MRAGRVYVNGILAGVITEETGKGYTFTYDDEYFRDPSCRAISLTMPKREKVYFSSYLFPFFSNMLSEGYNREVQARLHHIDQDDDFGILLATAYRDTAGAVTEQQI